MTADRLVAESRPQAPTTGNFSVSPSANGHAAIDLSLSEKLTEIGTWQRLLKEFMQKSGKLNDLISHFTQKFVQVGERRNFALTVLTDMAWTILILTWEAILQGELPIIAVGEMGFKERYDNLITQHQLCRAEWLKEISEMRDRRREKRYGVWFNDACHVKEEEVFRYVPEDALIGEETKEYFRVAVEEGVKVAFARTSETNLAEQLMMAERRLEATVAESEDLKYRVQELQTIIAERNSQKLKDTAYLKEDLKKAHHQQMSLQKQVESLTERLLDRGGGGDMRATKSMSRRGSTQSRASGAGDRDADITVEEVKHLRDNVRRLTTTLMQSQIDISEAEASQSPTSPTSVEPEARKRMSVVIADVVEVDDGDLGEDDLKQEVGPGSPPAAGGLRKRSKTHAAKASAKKSPSRRGSAAQAAAPIAEAEEAHSSEQQDGSPLVSQVRVREVRARENRMKAEREELEQKLTNLTQEKETLQRDKNDLEEKLQAYQWAELAPSIPEEKTPKTPKAPVFDFAAQEREDKLKVENQLLMQKLADGTSVQQSLEVEMGKLRARVEELKQLLAEKAADRVSSSDAGTSVEQPPARTMENQTFAVTTGSQPQHVVGRSGSRHSSEVSGIRTPSEDSSVPKGLPSAVKGPTISRAPSTGSLAQGPTMSRAPSMGSLAQGQSRPNSSGSTPGGRGAAMSRAASTGAAQANQGSLMTRTPSSGFAVASQQMGRLPSAGSNLQAQGMTRVHSTGGASRSLVKAGGMKPLTLQTDGFDIEELEATGHHARFQLVQEPGEADSPKSPRSAILPNFSPPCSRPPSARVAPAAAAVMHAMGQISRSAGQASRPNSPQASQTLARFRAASEHDPQDFFPSFLDEEELRRMVAEIRTYGSDGLMMKLRRGAGSRRPLTEYEAEATVAHLARLVRICGNSALVRHNSAGQSIQDDHGNASQPQGASKHQQQQGSELHPDHQEKEQQQPLQAPLQQHDTQDKQQHPRPPPLQTALVEATQHAQQCVQKTTSPQQQALQKTHTSPFPSPRTGGAPAPPQVAPLSVMQSLSPKVPQVKLAENLSQSPPPLTSKGSVEQQSSAQPQQAPEQQSRLPSRQPSMQYEQIPQVPLKEGLQIKELRQSQHELQEENKALQQQIGDLQEQVALLRQQLLSSRQLQRTKSKHALLEDRSLSPSTPKLMCQSQHMMLTPRHAAPTVTLSPDEKDSPPHHRPGRCASRGLDTAETPRRASSAGSEGGTDSQTLTLQMRARPRFVSDSAAQAQANLVVPAAEEPRTAAAPVKVPPLTTLRANAPYASTGAPTRIPSKAVLEGPAIEGTVPASTVSTASRKESNQETASRKESKQETASRKESKQETASIGSERRASQSSGFDEEKFGEAEPSESERSAPRRSSSALSSQAAAVLPRVREQVSPLELARPASADLRPESHLQEPGTPKSTATAGEVLRRESSGCCSSPTPPVQPVLWTQPDAAASTTRPALVRRQSSAASCPALPTAAVQSESRANEQPLLPAVPRRGSGAASPASRKRPTTASGVMQQQQQQGASGRVLFEADSAPALLLDMVPSGPPQVSASAKKGSKSKSSRTPVAVRIEPMIPTRPATAPDKLALALDNAARGGAEGRAAAVVPLRKRLNIEDWEVPGLKLRSGSPAKTEDALVHPLRLVDDWLQEPLQGQGIERISHKSPRQQSPSPANSPRAASKDKEKAQAAKDAKEPPAKQVDKKALAHMSAALQLRQKFVKTTFKSVPAKNRGADSKDRVMMQREYVPVAAQVKLQNR